MTLSRLVDEVQVANSMSLFYINKVAGDFHVAILPDLFDCFNFKNQPVCSLDAC
jgi:hypothetical protein